MTDMLLFEENKEVILNKIKVSPEMEEKVFFRTLILVSRYGAFIYITIHCVERVHYSNTYPCITYHIPLQFSDIIVIF